MTQTTAICPDCSPVPDGTVVPVVMRTYPGCHQCWRCGREDVIPYDGVDCQTCERPADWAGKESRVQCGCGTTVCADCCDARDGESYCGTCIAQFRDRARIAVLTQTCVIDALAPEHRPPRYEGNECSDEHVHPCVRIEDPKEHGCQRCDLLTAREAYVQGRAVELKVDTEITTESL